MVLIKEVLAKELDSILNFPKLRGTTLRTSIAYKAVRAVFQSIRDALLRGEEVKIDGFGIFKIIERPAIRHSVCHFYGPDSKVNNHEVISFPPFKHVTFKPSRVLLRLINDN